MPSSYENRAYKTLNKLNIKYITEKKVINNRYRIDIVILSYSIIRLWKLCIEIDGEYHKSLFDVYHDLKKLRILEALKSLITFIQDRIRDEVTYLCGYKVIRISYKKNIEKEIKRIIAKEKIYFWFKIFMTTTLLYYWILTV